MNISRNIKIGLHFDYALGKALTKFYSHLQAHGTFLEAVCCTCQRTYFPSVVHCTVCLATIEKWNELGPKAKLISHTVNSQGAKIGMFTFENSQAILFQRILVKDQEVFAVNDEMIPVICEAKVLSEVLKGFRPDCI